MNKLKGILGWSLILCCSVMPCRAQQKSIIEDSLIYRRVYRDTVIYRYDTVRIKYYVRTDTVWNSPERVAEVTDKRKIIFNPNSWGIGPSVGAYYSPFNGFDVNIGFGIQYYLFAVPSFRNPHLGHKKQKRK